MAERKSEGQAEAPAGATGMLKFRRAMTSIRDLNHQQSLFVPKARRLSEMQKMLHRDVSSLHLTPEEHRKRREEKGEGVDGVSQKQAEADLAQTLKDEHNVDLKVRAASVVKQQRPSGVFLCVSVCASLLQLN